MWLDGLRLKAQTAVAQNMVAQSWEGKSRMQKLPQICLQVGKLTITIYTRLDGTVWSVGRRLNPGRAEYLINIMNKICVANLHTRRGRLKIEVNRWF